MAKRRKVAGVTKVAIAKPQQSCKHTKGFKFYKTEQGTVRECNNCGFKIMEVGREVKSTTSVTFSRGIWRTTELKPKSEQPSQDLKE